MDAIKKIIVRNDDVNANTNAKGLAEIYRVLIAAIPNIEIWSAITIFSGAATKGSIYAEVPFKDKDLKWFYKNIEQVLTTGNHPKTIEDFNARFGHKVASHGLFHVDHSKLDWQAQEMSILSSCQYLKTDIFVPPFNRWNQDTVDICYDNDIKLFRDGWLSMEHNVFDYAHKMWYFHSWRWTPEKLKGYLDEYLRSAKKRENMGQLQEPTSHGTT